MKKTRKKLIFGAALAGSSLLTACHPEINIPVAVYGPPSYFEPESNIPEDVYGPPATFEPEENVPVDVYGPPSYWDGEDEAPAEDEAEIIVEDVVEVTEEIPKERPTETKPVASETESSSEYELLQPPTMDPAQLENIPECVYGPPSYWGGQE